MTNNSQTLTDRISPDLYRLERFYDTLVDRQYWFERNFVTIKAISPLRHYIIHSIYFSPTIMTQLDIIDSNPLYRDVELQKLIDLFATSVERKFGKRTDLLAGLPFMNETVPLTQRPRIRLRPGSLPNPRRPITVVFEENLGRRLFPQESSTRQHYM